MDQTIDFSQESKDLAQLRQEVGKVIVGQRALLDRLILSLLCNGHVLIEGIPGLAKTLIVNTLAKCLNASFGRVQFTPDLLPGDLTGTMIYNPSSQSFDIHKGPLFANIILADEINRSPAKVQSALLEAMQEHQVTLGGERYSLPEPFLVLATQNPIEQEGTYTLPEAQVDRFLFKLKLTYPSMEEEHLVMQRMAKTKPDLAVNQVMDLNVIIKMRDKVDQVYIDKSLERYILYIIDATRFPDKYGLDMTELVRFGASPRASLYLSLASRALALLNGRSYVIPQDIKELAPDILRHRIALSYRAEAKKIRSEDLIQMILQKVDVPQPE